MMNEKENNYIIDSDFILKIIRSSNDDSVFKKIVTGLNIIPILHPYVAYRELDTSTIVKNMIKENFLTVIEYEEFLPDQFVPLYESSFKDFYKFMNGTELNLTNGQTVRTYKKSKESLGEIHSCLLAQYLNIPILMSDDKGAKNLANLRVNSQDFKLTVLNIHECLIYIAKQKDRCITLDEALAISYQNKDRNKTKELKSIWKST